MNSADGKKVMLLPWRQSAVAAGNYSGLSASGDAPNWQTVAESDSWTQASQAPRKPEYIGPGVCHVKEGNPDNMSATCRL